jgi:serine phosphatase RsbU (regulator of sigma subunit)
VSGDFYWVKHQNSQSMIAIADCTGHGVPGAMLSILGVTGLNKIVHNTTEMRPDTTLEILRKDIITSLRQENDLIAKEGMDMAICLIDASTHKLEFAGAHQPGLIIRKGELIKLESSAQPIGRYLKETPFKQYSFELQNDDMIYLFTDGYFDQLGGEFTKKFMSRQFKEILIDIHKLACSEQLIHLKKVLNQWQGTNEQTDDITILGIRYQTN